jgi:hypothetical protein
VRSYGEITDAHSNTMTVRGETWQYTPNIYEHNAGHMCFDKKLRRTDVCLQVEQVNGVGPLSESTMKT